MIFGLFKALPDVGLKIGDVIEIERQEEKTACFYFGKVTKFGKKRSFFVDLYGNLPSGMANGEDVTLTVIHDFTVKSWKTKIINIDSGVVVTLTFYVPQEIECIDLPLNYEGLVVNIAALLENIVVTFRAMQSSHNQIGIIQEIRKEGLTMLSNLSIPEGTQLNISLELPYKKEIIIKGHVVKGESRADVKKHLVTVEFDCDDAGVIKDLMQFALFCFRRLGKYGYDGGARKL